jgi:hypothetical protein
MSEDVGFPGGAFYRIRITRVSIKRIRHQSDQFDAHTGDPDFEVSFLNDVPRPVSVIHHGITEIVIGYNDWKIGVVPDLFFKIVQPRIKIMVPSRFISHLRHELDVHFAEKEIEIRCALEDVAGIQEEHMFIFLPDLIDEHRPGCGTPKTCIARTILGEGFDAAVHIIGMEYDEFADFFPKEGGTIDPAGN